MNTGLKVSLSVAVMAISLNIGFIQPANATQACDIQPEIVSNVWEENNAEYASVSLNGKDLLTYKASADNNAAEERAEDLADKIKDLVNQDKFDANKLVPAKEGDVAVLKLDGVAVLKFDSTTTVDTTKQNAGSALEQSLKMVNTIRVAMGAPVIPMSFLKTGVIAPAPSILPEPIQTIASTTAAALSKLDLAAFAKAIGGKFSGNASWYGGKFNGRKTSDGSRFDEEALTAAHRSLPFGTKLLVTNRKTGDTCVVQVNDRGPFVGDRVIDLSKGAAKKLNMIGSGVAMVDCIVLRPDGTPQL
ncbi:MAG TPA: septal ring lytic transglycosylase RlpA family protein [Drouetiella sp.]